MRGGAVMIESRSDARHNQDHTCSGDATKEFKNAKLFEFPGVRDR
jgi:hypothetical protein